MLEKIHDKIDKFCNETDWKKYPTYEHALEEFVKGIVAEETKELQEELKKWKEQIKKMKNCNNCCNFEKDEDGLWNCKKGCFSCYCMGKGCKEWELSK